MKLPVAVLALLPLAGSAAGFDARMAQARAAIATREGYAYDLALVPAIHAAMVKCVLPGRAAARRADAFTLVASVDPAGQVGNVQVRPVTPLSLCFGRELDAMKLQPPPRRPRGAGPHPILVQVRDTF